MRWLRRRWRRDAMALWAGMHGRPLPKGAGAITGLDSGGTPGGPVYGGAG